MAVVVGTTTAVAGTLNFLIARIITEEITLSDSGATMGTPLTMVILTGLLRSTTICPYPSHLLHLAAALILKIFFLVPLFLLSISAFLSLTSFQNEGVWVLDLWVG